MNSKPVPQYFSVKQTSRILGFSTNSIYKFLKQERLQGIRGSRKQGRFRISRKSIDTFLGEPTTDDFIRAKLQPKKKPAPTTTTYTTPTPPQPLTPPATDTPPTHPIPLKVTRLLILLALVAVIVDLLFNRDFSLLQQLLRLGVLTIAVLLAYQFGDHYHHKEY